MGLELTILHRAPSLGSKRSTTELRPREEGQNHLILARFGLIRRHFL